MEKLFYSYAINELMDLNRFQKLTRDTKILDKKLTSTDIDIIFNKVKPKTDRKIDFDMFEDALKEMAKLKGVSLSDLENELSGLLEKHRR